jgi:hypothetical protein
MSNDVSEVRASSIIALMLAAARTSETSVDIDLTSRQYIPEDSELQGLNTVNLNHNIYDILYTNKYCDLYRLSSSKRFFLSHVCPDLLWGPPSLLFSGYGMVLIRSKARPGRDPDHSPHLVPSS